MLLPPKDGAALPPKTGAPPPTKDGTAWLPPPKVSEGLPPKAAAAVLLPLKAMPLPNEGAPLLPNDAAEIGAEEVLVVVAEAARDDGGPRPA